MTELAPRYVSNSKQRVPFLPLNRMPTFPARKQVPHAVDSPRPQRPDARREKHVTWEKNIEPNKKGVNKLLESDGNEVEKPAAVEDFSKKRQARKASSKGKLQWLFDQDRVYWESAQRESGKVKTSGTPSASPSPANSPELMHTLDNGVRKRSSHISPGKSPWVPVEQLSDSVNIGEDEIKGFGSSTDEESCNFDLEMSHLEMNAPEIQVFITTQQAPRILKGGVRCSKSPKSMSGFVSRVERPGRKGKKEGWRRQAAVLKAKCEVLRMEKELAQQRWKEGCAEMAQAAEMAHSLRAAVESILEPVRKRGTVSEPCTPRREKRKEELGEGLVARLHRLQTSSEGRSRKLDICAQWDLETQAQALHARIEMLQQRSQFRSSDSSTPDDSDNCAQQSDQTGTCSSTMPLQTIEEENKVVASKYHLMEPLPASGRDSKDAVYQLLKQAEDGCILEEKHAKEVQTKETVRQILSQIQAEAEQWKQVQEVLKHVSEEMVVLQHASLSWEKRALSAETQAASWQKQADEWRVKAQTSQQKIKELEAQMMQLQETVEGVKQRHALEQNRWLDVGSNLGTPSNLGYTLVLQPIGNNTASDDCRCSVSKDLEGCINCGNVCQTSRQDLDARDASDCDRRASGAPRFPSPRRSLPREATELNKVRQKNQNASLHVAPVSKTTKGNVQPPACQRSRTPKSDKERSVSLERSSQKVPVTRSSPARSERVYVENQENMSGGSQTASMPKKMGVLRGQSPVRKVAPSPAPSCRGSSPQMSNFSVLQRAPLKDMRVNISVGH